MAEDRTPTAEEMMRELPGFYDQSKIRAYQSCVIDLARCGGINLLEMMVALRNVLLATETQLASKAGKLEVPESIRELAEEASDLGAGAAEKGDAARGETGGAGLGENAGDAGRAEIAGDAGGR